MTFKRMAPILVVTLVFLFCVSLMVGAVAIPLNVTLNTLFGLDGPTQNFIINRSRLPRALLAMLCGAALASSGVMIQAILRNPLASPKILGINAGAALGVLMTASFAETLGFQWVPAFAILGGVLVAMLVYLIAELRPISPARLALTGVAIGFCLDAALDFILVTADTYAISAPLVWLTGSLWGRGWDDVARTWPLITPLLCLSLIFAFRVDLIRLGTVQAQGLGVNVRRTRLIILTLASFLAAVSVSAVGVVGFVGLMAPHIARLSVGGQHKVLLPIAMLIGAILVLGADTLGRALLPPIEVSAGILTALLGAPFFIWILLTNGTEEKT